MTDRVRDPIIESTYVPGKNGAGNRHRRVYHHVPGADRLDRAVFHAEADPDASPPTFHVHTLTRAEHDDLACPDIITVTVEPGDALNDLAGARYRVERAKRDVVDQVREARRNGRTWDQIGKAFGVTRQTAWQTYAPLIEG